MTFSATNCPRRGASPLLAVLLVLMTAAIAAADTGRVLVEGALVWNRPNGFGVILTQLGRGERVELIQRVGEWYEVVVPQGRSTVRIGYVRASQLEIVQRGPLSAEAQRLRATAPRTAAAPARPIYLNPDFAFRLGATDFIRTATAFSENYAEEGSITTNHGNGSGPLFDLMLTQAFYRRFGAGVAFSFYNRQATATLRAEVPHPFFFNQHRLLETDTVQQTSGSRALKPKGSEIGLHVPFTYLVKSSNTLRVSAYGGPSVFFIRQDVITDLTLDDPYPHETVTLTGYTAAERKGTQLGFHLGADVSYFVAPRYGFGAGVRYSTATLALKNDDGAATEGKAGGGVQVSGGLRVRF